MFGTLLLAVYTLMIVYLVWRSSGALRLQRRPRLKAALGVGAVLWLTFVAGRFLGHDGVGALAAALEWAGMVCLGSVFLVFITTLAADLVTGFGSLLPRHAPRIRAAALLVGLALSGVALTQGAREPAVSRHEVVLPGLPRGMDGAVVVALSDLHLGQLTGEDWLRARVRQVQALTPDLVVLLGDVHEGHGPPLAHLAELLGQVSAPLGRWYVAGNHDAHGRRGRGPDLAVDAGFTLLDDRWQQVRPGLVLAGVSDLGRHGHRPGRSPDPIGQALAGRPPGAAILLSHQPVQAERARSAGAGLMLSGHTHGGQIWPFSLLVALRYRLLAGRYDVGGMPVIVCRGTSTWGPPMRLWRRGEILHVTLRAAAATRP